MLQLFRAPPRALFRSFTTTAPILKKQGQLPPKPKPPPDNELEESYLKGSGPGGQKIVIFHASASRSLR